MSLASVTDFFATRAPDIAIQRYATSTATVALAAEALGVVPGQIAKTLSLRLDDEVVLLVARGDARIDNRKYKDTFGQKARMLGLDEVERETGHPVGGVCPFGLARPLRVFCDVSLKAFDEVFPAAGAPDAAVRLTPARLAVLTRAEWVDVAQDVGVAVA
ncbi:YbaK/EbsC family protein [Telluria mixta]|uniref:YbaK/EbsC family protein n=1 Tax=Telluria mixta TaxID=34071 RepID=A0ABT2BY97_9BURK|nr:YbaK/EbsC family protein [Telluria mixta]MCS0630119.1 YbaK/EbsC family protein [Telluria mixta]WEM94567.1 YbaK/EbsC family protein [Telluria mixta]